MRMIFYTIGLMCGITAMIWYGWLSVVYIRDELTYGAFVKLYWAHWVGGTVFVAISLFLIEMFRKKPDKKKRRWWVK